MSTATAAAPPADDERLRRLDEVWGRRPGLRGWAGAVNHKIVGRRFIYTALAFLAVGGIEAMVMRTQLARPEGGVVGPEGYNQLFTLHGTTMMFLFAVPIVEGFAMLVLPLMLGTRDMPFPRLNAFGYWAYLAGGLLVYASVPFGDVPDGGWFAYVPLTGPEFSPSDGLDFWLLGVTFAEISGIVGAIEILVLILRHRAPGMTLSRIPLFGWAVLGMAGMMLFAFPAVVAASLLLELERTYGLPFFDPALGGEPLLWQHLFWIFGHPEVYIMLLPAVGIISTVIPTSARRPIVGYRWVVVALITIAFTSFGLWVHHMFAVGIPLLAMSFFTAASMLIAIPSGIQVFAWIATIWRGAVRWSTPLLFSLGFIVIFVLGGITGVMVAVVPFDWQVHDSFFVVAHFHYVLLGGVVFPIIAGLHHWWPKIAGRMFDERLGHISFWAMFVGFNVTFFPQHFLGLDGMPRRVYSYGSDEGWGGLNLLSTLGSYLLGLGFLVVAINLGRSLLGPRDAPADPWQAGTLEWATASPPPSYNFDELPVVTALDPLWEEQAFEPSGELAEVRASLREPNHGHREVWGTTPIDADVEEIVLIAQPSVTPLITALAISVALVGVLADLSLLAGAGAVAAAAAIVVWLWPSREEVHDEGLAGSERLEPPAPTRRRGSHVSGSYGLVLGVASIGTVVAAFVFSYYRLLATSPQWPPAGAAGPGAAWPAVGVAAAILASGAALAARRSVMAPVTRVRLALAAVVALGALSTWAAVEAVDQLAIAPTEHAYGAITALLLGCAGTVAAVGTCFGVAVAVQAITWPPEERPLVPAGLVVVWWAFTALVWTAVAGTVVLTPGAL